jgi:NTP pyrophosphatase (non-canonical NTP hydrolase)
MSHPQLTTNPWPALADLAAWLDRMNGRGHDETTMRILKVTEESGEVAAAWVGVTGQNPRKGITHTLDDVADELCDVAVAALVALYSVTTDPAGHFDRKLQQIAEIRVGDQAQ